MIRALIRLGWTLDRTGGRPLKEPLARAILKQAGVSEDEFFDAYRATAVGLVHVEQSGIPRPGHPVSWVGAPPAAVATVLGHADVKTTMERCAALSPGFMRSEVERLRMGFPVARLATPVRRRATGENIQAGSSSEKPEEFPASEMERETGFEPAPLSLGTVFTECPTTCKDVQPFAIPTDPVSEAVQRSRENPLLFEEIATPLRAPGKAWRRRKLMAN
jgi:hypothetical protein